MRRMEQQLFYLSKRPSTQRTPVINLCEFLPSSPTSRLVNTDIISALFLRNCTSFIRTNVLQNDTVWLKQITQTSVTTSIIAK